MSTGEERFLASLIHIEEKRDPDSVVRRTDFNYLGGHGTFYYNIKRPLASYILVYASGRPLDISKLL